MYCPKCEAENPDDAQCAENWAQVSQCACLIGSGCEECHKEFMFKGPCR